MQGHCTCKLLVLLPQLPSGSQTNPAVTGRAALQGTSDPEKVFDRTSNLEGTQIISYRVDPLEKWAVLIGIAPGAPER